MKKFKKSLIIISSIALLSGTGALFLSSCDNGTAQSTKEPSIKILNGESTEVNVGEYVTLEIESKNITSELQYISSNEDIAIVSQSGRVYGLKEGEVLVSVKADGALDTIKVFIKNASTTDKPSIEITSGDNLEVGLLQSKVIEFYTTNFSGEVNANLSSSGIIEIGEITKNSISVKGLKEGTVTLTLSINSEVKDSIKITVKNIETGPIAISLSKNEVKTGEDVEIIVDIDPGYSVDDVIFYVVQGRQCIEIEKTTIHTLTSGYTEIIAQLNGVQSNKVGLTIYDFTIRTDTQVVEVGKYTRIQLSGYLGNKYNLQPVLSNPEIGTVTIEAMGDFFFTAKKSGTTNVFLRDNENGNRSNVLTIEVIGGNPYEGVTAEEFYSNYTRSPNYQDSLYRTNHYFMSGDIAPQDQKPTISEMQLMVGDKFVHNSTLNYENDGKTYIVPDAYGNKAFEIYEGAAYVSLEEVAAYVYAFGDVPPNYTASKKTRPTESNWKEYLRVNNSLFSGDTSSYPYEPILPNISGCGGNLQYYEIDIGTTGTDCDPNYSSEIYNNGIEIVRGAARIVYSKTYEDTGEPVRPEDRYVFYTYNHYNDFQEYLNYQNGWGKMFGNITGGGVISSKNPALCNPTPYVETIRSPLK